MAPPSPWTYVDDRRTHEVRVSLEVGKTLELVIREMAFGGAPSEEVYTERHPLGESWEQKLRVLALETRLSRMGNYYKSGPAGWTPVRLARAGNKVDLAPLSMEGGGDTIEFHHFTREANQAVSLVGVHQDTDRGRRSLLVRLDYRFPDTQGGNLHVVHARLTPLLYRSALASLHDELAEDRYQKSAPDARRIADPRSWALMRAALDAILARLIDESSAHIDNLTDGLGRPLDAQQLTVVQQATKAAGGAASAERGYSVDFEVDPSATSVDGKKPELTIEELSPDVFTALQEPRLLALHTRFMPGDAEAQLFARGERAIGLVMRDLRGSVRPDEQHLVSLLEASLLLRYALRKRIPVDPDVIKRVKHARAYL
jgi:hypothetical protein